MEKVRIAKFIADAGVCSRRDAEKLIENGDVKLNGEILDTPAVKVDHNDKVHVKDRLIKRRTLDRLWIMNKPKGVITTHNDPQGRKTVFDILPKSMPRLISVGRLDLNTEGLLLLTTSGELARKYELPETGLKRIYRVRVFGDLNDSIINQLAKGVVVDGIRYGQIIVTIEKVQSRNAWAKVELKEGKNREIRKAFEHFGLAVNRLIRLSYGPYELGTVELGQVMEVQIKKI